MAPQARPSRQPESGGASRHAPGARGGNEPAQAPKTAVGKLAQVAGSQRESREQLIYASNWRTPLIIDICLGGAVLIAGLVLSIAWNPIGGGGIGALGGLYALLAVRRWRKWAELRAARLAELNDASG